jgi:hypothetical protein
MSLLCGPFDSGFRDHGKSDLPDDNTGREATEAGGVAHRKQA